MSADLIVTAEQVAALRAEMKDPRTSKERREELRLMRRDLREMAIKKVERGEWTRRQAANFMGYTSVRSMQSYFSARRPLPMLVTGE